jgi:phosphohistidine phosphatase
MTGAPGRRQLYLLRHAKSSWDDPGVDDHDRPLAGRGEKALARMREHLARAAAGPELVLCSSARRTRMTLDGIADALPADVDIEVEDGLYAATGGALLSRLHQVPDDVGRVMLIGHNPGLEDLALLLVGAGDPSTRARMATKFPTGALATLGFDGPWAALDADGATLEGFVVPREL